MKRFEEIEEIVELRAVVEQNGESQQVGLQILQIHDTAQAGQIGFQGFGIVGGLFQRLYTYGSHRLDHFAAILQNILFQMGHPQKLGQRIPVEAVFVHEPGQGVEAQQQRGDDLSDHGGFGRLQRKSPVSVLFSHRGLLIQ
ncbi:hypothetical protein [Hydrogenimonas sp.]